MEPLRWKGLGSIPTSTYQRSRPVEAPDHAADDVVDVGEVPPVFPVVEDLDRLALGDRSREQHGRHIRATPGTVDGKETETGNP